MREVYFTEDQHKWLKRLLTEIREDSPIPVKKEVAEELLDRINVRYIANPWCGNAASSAGYQPKVKKK